MFDSVVFVSSSFLFFYGFVGLAFLSHGLQVVVVVLVLVVLSVLVLVLLVPVLDVVFVLSFDVGSLATFILNL